MTKVKTSELSEKAIQNLEAHIPEMAAGATYAAYIRALAAGHSVLRVQGSNVVETKADGASRVVAKAKPRRKVTVGQIITVKRLPADA
ncbi:hypothetical protein [Pseudomonas viridiflava]|uniref:hypothetical protein n=1 Tax=Pseudomonas viridiflava TaxID=33069 RepID=UPI000F026457|nr:hypothetical protein [Pseudomonas viridiflava]